MKQRFSLAFAALAVLLALAPHAKAQLGVTIYLKRTVYMWHEPIIATVTITNRTGRDIILADTPESGPWFSFEIGDSTGASIQPRDRNYSLTPLEIKAGDTVKRSANLTELYEIDGFGSFKAKARVYFSQAGKFYTSHIAPIEITEGTLIWKQVVGVPDGFPGAGSTRAYSLLTVQHERTKSLYVRLDGQEDGTTYACYELGPIVADFPPDHQFDRANNLWILQLTGQKTYSLWHIGIDGKFLGQDTYVTPKHIPNLRRLADGTVQLVGAIKQERIAAGNPAANAPKLSDRPPGMTGQ